MTVWLKKICDGGRVGCETRDGWKKVVCGEAEDKSGKQRDKTRRDEAEERS